VSTRTHHVNKAKPAEQGDQFIPVVAQQGGVRAELAAIFPFSIERGNVLRADGSLVPAVRRTDGSVFVLEVEVVEFDEDLVEQRDRATTVRGILERCAQELDRLERIPNPDADDVNALSAAKGYVQRAEAVLARRFS
jgi:hypothetical protein